MTERIVVGVDGSAAAAAAWKWAVTEARLRGCSIELVHAFTGPATFVGPPGMVSVDPTDHRTSAVAVLDAVAHLARADAPDLDISEVLVERQAAKALAEVTRDASMLVLGARGHSSLASLLLLGSVSRAVLHLACCPVVVVPEVEERPAPSHRRVVVGIDGSPTADHALAWAHQEACIRDAELVVVHAWTDPFSGGRATVTVPHDVLELDAARVIDHSLASLTGSRHSAVRIKTKMPQAAPAEALLDEAARADLLVVGTRGRGGFSTLLLGSVAQHVAQHAPCPTAVIGSRLG